ncbi:MAG TPA: AsmA-like C-terminal region-containing protein, partial [Thiotrichales bacterium]|nr:AsmA-like C-terminal region-containing protein [Thiotrichales bacterium]
TQWLNSLTDWRLINLSLLPLKTTHTPAKQSIKLVLPKVNGDMWLSWWERYQANTTSVGVNLTERGHISMTQFDLMGQSFHAVNLDWQKGQENTGWLKIQSPEVNGTLNWQGEDMKLHLSNLLFKHHILSVAEKKAEGAPQCRTPSSRVWPKLSVSIDKLLLETWRESRIVTSELTNIKAQIKQQGSVRSAKDIEFRSKTLAAKLDWDWDIASQRSSLFINARAEQAIDLTRLVGIDNAINSGSIELSSLQSWPGGLDCYDSRLISGSLDMRADDGVLSEASPGGFSRLLGLLSFDAFTRRLKMGLGDVVNQGLAFDKIILKSTLNRGVLQVESLAVTSSAMNIDLSGTSSINNETHNLQAKVTPLIGDTIPTMALLSGASPITAIGYYLLQKIIPPLGGNFITLNYRITGSWQEPILDEISAP